jgi:hypothetical protein
METSRIIVQHVVIYGLVGFWLAIMAIGVFVLVSPFLSSGPSRKKKHGAG